MKEVKITCKYSHDSQKGHVRVERVTDVTLFPNEHALPDTAYNLCRTVNFRPSVADKQELFPEIRRFIRVFLEKEFPNVTFTEGVADRKEHKGFSWVGGVVTFTYTGRAIPRLRF